MSETTQVPSAEERRAEVRRLFRKRFPALAIATEVVLGAYAAERTLAQMGVSAYRSLAERRDA